MDGRRSGMLASALIKVARDKLVTGLRLGDAAAATMPDDEKLKHQAEELMQRMDTIAEVVGDAERRSFREEAAREWLIRLEDAGYGIWDMVNELQANNWKPVTEVHRPCLPIGNSRKEESIASRMFMAKVNLDDLLHLGGESSLAFWRGADKGKLQKPLDDAHPMTPPCADKNEEYIVGFDEYKRRIMDIISSEDSDSNRGLFILPIVGDGGIGKTTIAKMVFSDASTVISDYARAWVTVGRRFDLKKIGNCILSQVSNKGEHQDSSGDVALIMKRLHQFLLGNKLLVVLDDLWPDDRDDLAGLGPMLAGAGKKKDSKVIVIITTRREGVLKQLKVIFWTDALTDLYRMRALTLEDSWHLLNRKLGFTTIPDNDWVYDMLRKCEGVPLAIHAIGSTLRSKSPEEIRSVVNSDIWNQVVYPDVHPALLLSYQCMPPNLKLCFAYCAIFPSGHTILKDDLIHHWTALQLIEPSSDTLSTTQLATRYIGKLLDMSFLQPSMHHPSDDGCAVSFTMPDLVHDLAMLVSGESSIVVYSDDWSSVRQEDSHRRAWLTYSDINPAILSYTLSAQLEVLLFYGCSDKQISDDSFSSAKYLHVLDLIDCQLQKLPESICQLRLLRYLNLSGSTSLVDLPDSFGNLINLGHIDLSSCSCLLKLPDSFGNLTNVIHVNLSGCVGLKSLPKLFGNLTNVIHVNLSGCVGLKSLPGSFGNLTNVIHVNLSGCVGLKSLPGSFGNLTNVIHVNLSGCVGLKSLPNSFGNLTNVTHVNLSGCVGLKSLPKSFRWLEKLEYLDLSSCSCLEGIPSVVEGQTNLQHLNLSHPCCYVAQHRFHLRELKGVWVNLTNLRYLNLSMCLNPIFCYLPQERIKYIESISCLHTLEDLDLSHNIFLFDLPESLGQLSQLQTLNLSGCTRLKRINKWMGEKNFPNKSLVVSNCLGLEMYQFVVRTDEDTKISNLSQLKDVSCKELEISCLEKVICTEEAQNIRLPEKKKLLKLTLLWSAVPDDTSSKNDEALLAELVPPKNLQCFELHGYGGEHLPSWLTSRLSLSSYLPNLLEVSLVDIPSCGNLPPFGVLPSLQRLILRRVAKVTKIDAGCLSGGSKAAFHGLLHVTLDGMANLEEFSNCSSSDELVMFPSLIELVISSCPKLRFVGPPPKARMLVISDCNQLMSYLVKRGQHEGPVTEVVIESCKVPLDELNWSLLEGLEPLHSLHIRSCSEKIISPEIMKGHLSPLKLLCFSHCDSMTNLPEHLVQDTSLQELLIHGCRGIKSLPQSICEKKKKLRIRQCPELEKWYNQLEENKRKLAQEHIILEGESSSSQAETSAKCMSD